MKSLTFVHASRLDLNELGPRVVSIRDHFDKYLDEYPVKSARSKHGLLGPVGKILQEAKGDRWDAISLAGYALNIHLANPRSRKARFAPPDWLTGHEAVHTFKRLFISGAVVQGVLIS